MYPYPVVFIYKDNVIRKTSNISFSGYCSGSFFDDFGLTKDSGRGLNTRGLIVLNLIYFCLLLRNFSLITLLLT
jgi:hypothetical protein